MKESTQNVCSVQLLQNKCLQVLLTLIHNMKGEECVELVGGVNFSHIHIHKWCNLDIMLLER